MRRMLGTSLAAVAAAAALFGGVTTATAAEAPDGVRATQTEVTPVPGAEGVYKYTGGDFRAAAWADCGGGSCFFSEFDGGGYRWTVPSCGRHNVPTWFNDLATSAWNRTPTTILIFKDSNSGGYLGPMPGWFQGNLAYDHNNKMSSVDALC